MKRILITGVAGFIGSHLAKYLLTNTNCTVVGIDNFDRGDDSRLKTLVVFENFTFYRMNICCKDDVLSLFTAYHFDIVVHLAARAGVRFSTKHPSKTTDSNISGFINILESCRLHKPENFIFASSSSVYECNSVYAATKKTDEILTETYSKNFGLKYTGFRFFSVYGEYGRPDMAYYDFSKKILENQPVTIFGDGSVSRDYTYIDDVVECISKAAFNPANNKIYDVGFGKSISILDVVKELEYNFSQKAVIKFTDMPPSESKATLSDNSEFFKDYNFKPQTEFKDGIRKFAEWFKEYYNK